MVDKATEVATSGATSSPAQSVVTGTKAFIDTTWSVLSFVLGSESEWPGYNAEEA